MIFGQGKYLSVQLLDRFLGCIEVFDACIWGLAGLSHLRAVRCSQLWL